MTLGLIALIRIVGGGAAYLVLAAVVCLDAWLLYRFFSSAARFDLTAAT